MKKHRFIALLIIIFSVSIFTGCFHDKDLKSNCVINSEDIDYSNSYNWAVIPTENNFKYDVFYIYPTVILTGKNGEMDINLEENREAAIANSKGATALMSSFANVYAPFYRQASLDAFEPFEDFSVVIDKSRNGINDIELAFSYYLHNLNQGRPFVIFGHSQGAAVAFEILKNNFHNSLVRENFVAAYLSGMLLMRDELAKYPYLKFAENSDDIGVILVWNVQSPEVKDNFFVKQGGLGINPANWRVDTEKSDARVIESKSGRKYFEPASILDPKNGATLVTLENPERYEMEVFGSGVYHIGNISLYINSISENIHHRLKIFENSKK